MSKITTKFSREELGCQGCGWDYLCAPASREINYKSLKERRLSKCPAQELKVRRNEI